MGSAYSMRRTDVLSRHHFGWKDLQEGVTRKTKLGLEWEDKAKIKLVYVRNLE
jgi:hypothetical protein